MDDISVVAKTWFKIIDYAFHPWKPKSLIKNVTMLKWDHAWHMKN